jgi:hypothetical protein
VPAEPERCGEPANPMSPVPSVVRQLVVPHGFTLTTAGTLAILLQIHPRPGMIAIFLFIIGAAVGFCSIAVVSGAPRDTKPVKAAGGPQLMNVTPVLVVPLVISVVAWTPEPHLTFPVAGLLTTWIYVLAVAFLFRCFEHRK